MSVCVSCGADKVKRKRITTRRPDGVAVTVPAWVCATCGEQVFDMAVAQFLEQARPGRTKRRFVR